MLGFWMGVVGGAHPETKLPPPDFWGNGTYSSVRSNNRSCWAPDG